MANEIRVLEDQLYDADYQNRVLRDELARVKKKCDPVTGEPIELSPPRTVDSVPRQSYGPPVTNVPAPLTDSYPTNDGAIHVGDDFGQHGVAAPPLINPGAPVGQDIIVTPGETIVDQNVEGAVPNSVPYVAPPYAPTPDPATDNSATNESAKAAASDDPQPRAAEALEAPEPDPRDVKDKVKEAFESLPAPNANLPKTSPPKSSPPKSSPYVPPAEAIPPGKESLKAPELLPGNLPPTRDGIENPFGQIQLPKEVNDLIYSTPSLPELTPPEHIRLHPALSGGHQFDQDDDVDGMYIVVNVVDKDGRAVNLHGFDIDASMTIVALDPEVDPNTGRIGRWDFTSEEIGKYVRSIPVDGLHVPVKWQGVEPIGDEVIVHVRLQAEEEEMRCQGRVKLNKETVVAKWLPRGEKLR